jgi:hypothetical protein
MTFYRKMPFKYSKFTKYLSTIPVALRKIKYNAKNPDMRGS